MRVAVRQDLDRGITSFVVSGVFSPVTSSQETRVKQILEDEIHQASAEGGNSCSAPFADPPSLPVDIALHSR